ncbi:zinc finger, C3HC4 type (RING finger) domain-containing protein [Toxoplasma gondii ARI]|uniref:Zinc finger, C3HC4 type (RING finger) domain-containing protein n=1 Tax=Toxoplasma gondii ARI TaxID=1074872 RepID=A0A139Y6C8_TOXGO|nr:zinc finger, C3HC4 type (RING finger) domain-containing protein [Toxoplasma gondii ARI]
MPSSSLGALSAGERPEVHREAERTVEHFRCRLCSGYFREAVTIKDCLHSFCKWCLLARAEKGELEETCCPRCEEKLTHGLCHHNDIDVRRALPRVSAAAAAEAGGSAGASVAAGVGSVGSVSSSVSSPASGAPPTQAPVLFDRSLQNLIDKLFPRFAREEALEREELRRFLAGERPYSLLEAEETTAQVGGASPGTGSQRCLLGGSAGEQKETETCAWSSVSSAATPRQGAAAGSSPTVGVHPTLDSSGLSSSETAPAAAQTQEVLPATAPSREEFLEELVKGRLALFDDEETLAVALVPDQAQALALLSQLSSQEGGKRRDCGEGERPQEGGVETPRTDMRTPSRKKGEGEGGKEDAERKDRLDKNEKHVFSSIDDIRRKLGNARREAIKRRHCSSSVPSSLWPLCLPALDQPYLRVDKRMPVMHLLRYLAARLLPVFASGDAEEGDRERARMTETPETPRTCGPTGASSGGGRVEAETGRPSVGEASATDARSPSSSSPPQVDASVSSPDGVSADSVASASAASRASHPPARFEPVSRSLLAELESSLELTLEGRVLGRNHTLQFVCKAHRLAFCGRCLLLAYQWTAQAEGKRMHHAVELLKQT